MMQHETESPATVGHMTPVMSATTKQKKKQCLLFCYMLAHRNKTTEVKSGCVNESRKDASLQNHLVKAVVTYLSPVERDVACHKLLFFFFFFK